MFTWVYRKEKPPFEASTVDIGVEKDFYGGHGEINADLQIQELEQSFGRLIAELMAVDDGTDVSNLDVAEFVAHLSFRTRHLRESLRQSLEYLVGRMREYLSDPENVKAVVLSKRDLLRSEIEKKSSELGFSGEQRARFLFLGQNLLPLLLEQKKADIQLMLQRDIEVIMDTLPRALKEGHIQALVKMSVPWPRAELYHSLQWHVHKSTDQLILGDFGPLFEIGEMRTLKILDDKNDQIRNIYLPISSSRILIGTSSSDIPRIDPTFINQAIVRRSMEYFVCSELSPHYDELRLSIGEHAGIVSKEELQELASQLIRQSPSSQASESEN